MAPIIIPGTPKRKRNYQREHFNAAVKALAPIIAAIRNKGAVSVPDIMECLNDRGVAAPNGGLFTTGSTHRVLTRLAEMTLGPGPRSVSDALTDRWSREADEMRERYERDRAERLALRR
jgi:hypothetical protein